MNRSRASRGLHTIFERSLREIRRSLAGWMAGIAAYCLVLLAMYPSIHGNKDFSKLLDVFPEAMRKLFNLSDYTTGAGYLRTEVFSFIAPLLLAIFAILWGADLTAGEEERRTIDALLATPVSRRRVILEKWLALCSATVLLSVVLELVLGLIGPLFRLHVGWAPLSAVVAGSCLFALSFGTMAMTVGAGTGSRGLARGVTGALAVATYLISTLAQLVDWLKPWEWTSLWYHAFGSDPLTNSFNVGHLSVLVACIVVLVVLATMLFDRRDFSN
ncbi:MAG TPA: ABC transporter permease subunit [Acidimicrobiales bacterium]|nr:ABC transporter permease subunit [Acidimicrobiales bacterium]